MRARRDPARSTLAAAKGREFDPLRGQRSGALTSSRCALVAQWQSISLVLLFAALCKHVYCSSRGLGCSGDRRSKIGHCCVPRASPRVLAALRRPCRTIHPWCDRFPASEMHRNAQQVHGCMCGLDAPAQTGAGAGRRVGEGTRTQRRMHKGSGVPRPPTGCPVSPTHTPACHWQLGQAGRGRCRKSPASDSRRHVGAAAATPAQAVPLCRAALCSAMCPSRLVRPHLLLAALLLLAGGSRGALGAEGAARLLLAGTPRRGDAIGIGGPPAR